MLKTIIIDDEALIREGLRTSIEWNNLGYEIIGEAADGEQAIELIQKTLPDVIITDIRMPFMSGLELVEFIKPTLPNAFIIIISGHDEFHYAQKALQLGVYDFILKPFDLDYFIKILTKIKYDYTLRKRHQVKQIPAEDLQQLQCALIESAVFNRMPREQLDAKLGAYQLSSITDHYFSTTIVQIDNFHLSIADYTFDQINDIHKEFHKNIYSVVEPSERLFVIEGHSGDVIIVVNSLRQSETTMKTDKIISQLRAVFKQESSLSVTIAYSSVIRSIYNIAKTYKQAHEVCNQRFVMGYGQNLSYESYQENASSRQNPPSYPQIGFNRDTFMAYVKEGNPEVLTDYIDGIFGRLVDDGHNSSLYVTMFVTSIYVELLNYLNQYDLSINNIFDDPLLLYRNLTISKNIYDTKDLIKDVTLKTSDFVLSQNSKAGNARISQAKKYIDGHFSSPEITLQEVAEHVNMGVCYFSSMFKKETGESFINYLTSIRIAKAKELFDTTYYKSYEVSYMVGYNTPTYFSTLFKKIIGLSPSEYKNRSIE